MPIMRIDLYIKFLLGAVFDIERIRYNREGSSIINIYHCKTFLVEGYNIGTSRRVKAWNYS